MMNSKLLPLLCVVIAPLGWVEAVWAEGPTVSTHTIAEGKLTDQYEISGRVQAAQRVSIVPRVGGVLEQRLFTEGGRVAKGEKLFVIEQRPYQIKVKQAQAQLKSARAALKQAQAELKRLQTLRKSGATSRSSLESAEATRDQAAATVQQAEAGLEQAQLELGYTEISSPLAGKIGRTSQTAGNLVSANGSPLATVVQTDPVYVEISVSNKLLLAVRRQSPELKENAAIPSLILADGKPYTHTGQFDFIDPELNPDTDSIQVRATFPNPDGLLLPGEYVKVYIQPKDAKDVLLVPQVAVQRDKDGFYVLLVNAQNTVEQRRVVLSEQDGINWTVVSGLKQGEQVITLGLQKVQVGQTVTVAED